ncbi:MAG: VOC family protein [Burkholderiaceae bacterium]
MRNPPPAGWPQLSSSVFYRDPAKAIAWLCDAFGFELRLKVEGEPGEIVYSELVYGGALVSVSASAKPGDAVEPGREFKARHASPRDLGGRNTQALCLFVDDADAHCAQARAQGATIYAEPATHDYGDDYWSDRSYGADDCEGHAWWFMHRIRDKPAQ